MVNIMAVNNELGTIEPVNEAAHIIKSNMGPPYFMLMQFRHMGKYP